MPRSRKVIAIAFVTALFPATPPVPSISSQLSAKVMLPQSFPPDPPTSCPVTQPSAHPFVPPRPYPATPGPGYFWFGAEKLWTIVPTNGTWNRLPHYTPDDPTFRQKLLYWSAGFQARSEPQPALLITGKRLDAPAPPLASDQANGSWRDPNQSFIVTAINLPTLGCWQITARYHEQTLSFTVLVAQ